MAVALIISSMDVDVDEETTKSLTPLPKYTLKDVIYELATLKCILCALALVYVSTTNCLIFTTHSAPNRRAVTTSYNKNHLIALLTCFVKHFQKDLQQI